jgi:hypothetical protein
MKRIHPDVATEITGPLSQLILFFFSENEIKIAKGVSNI